MTHDKDELTNPGHLHGFADDPEAEGTEERTQVDSHHDRLSSDELPPLDGDERTPVGIDDLDNLDDLLPPE